MMPDAIEPTMPSELTSSRSGSRSVVATPAAAQQQHIGDQPEALNMRLVGYNDLQARSAYQPTIHKQGDRYIAYVGHHGGTPTVPKPVNPMTGQPEFNGTSIIDVTDPKNPKYLKHLPGLEGNYEEGGAQMVRICDGKTLPKGDPSKVYMLRVFGGKAEADKAPAPDDATKARVAAGLRELGLYGSTRNVTVIIESHDHFTSSATLADVLHAANSEHVGLLWDAHHTFATSNEDPEFTVKQLGQWIRHTHLKDSVGTGEDRKYVLTGTGNVPIMRQIKALQSIGYKGFYCFEWEKVWHPDIADPSIDIPDFARVVGRCLGNAKGCGA